ncbi:uncharacterized protein METZ01_LOCUS506323, partial [marine metagenome]
MLKKVPFRALSFTFLSAVILINFSLPSQSAEVTLRMHTFIPPVA